MATINNLFLAIILSYELDFEGKGVPVLGKIDATLLGKNFPAKMISLKNAIE